MCCGYSPMEWPVTIPPERESMKTHSSPTGPVNRHLKFSVFQRWLEDNPIFEKDVPKEDLFNFFQHIVKALRGAETSRLYQFLDFYIPLISRHEVDKDELADSSLKLRSLLIEHIINDVQIAQKIKDLLITRTLSLFETLDRYTQEKYSRYHDQKRLTGAAYLQQNLPAQGVMAFVVRGERFANNAVINDALRHRLVLSDTDGQSSIDWESQIHPEDFHKTLLILDDLKRRKSSVYEIGYRLMTHEGQWEHVTELGRIFYGQKDQVSSVAGILSIASRERDDSGIDRQIQSTHQWLFQSGDEVFLLVDLSGEVIWSSQGFIETFLEGNSLDPSSRQFTELFDTENRIVAERFWKSLKNGENTSDMRLTASANGHAYGYQFHCIDVNNSFRQPAYLFNARRTREDIVYNQMTERLRQLAVNANALHKISDSETFYQSICEAGLEFFEGLSCGFVLTKGKNGYHFKYATGVNDAGLERELILNDDIRQRLKSLAELNSTAPDAFILNASDVTPILRKYLPRKTQYKLNQALEFSKLDQIAGVVLYRDNQAHTIVGWPVFKGQTQFTVQDRTLLSTLSAHGSAVLTKIYFSRKLNQLQFNLIATTEHSPLATMTIYRDIIVDVNPRLCELISLSKRDLLGKPLANFLSMEDQQNLPDTVGALKRLTAKATRDLTLVGQDGTLIEGRSTFSNIQYNGKRALLLQIEDLTRQKNLEKQLSHAQRLEGIGSLTNGIVHDFNNILGAIIPTAQLIYQYPQAEETRDRGKVVLDMARRADQITQQLLDYVKRSKPESDVLDLNALLTQSQNIFAKIAGAEMDIEYILGDSLPGIKASSTQMLQMLINLVTNARDAMSGGGRLQIGTRISRITRTEGPFDAFKPGTYVQLTVRDSGKGIPKNIREKIFEPFFTTKSEKHGSGLGLSIVYGILKKHDGYVLVQSAESKGTTFKIFLPVTDEKPIPAAIVEPPAVEAMEPVAGQGKVLIVDDEFYLREVLGSMVKMMGFEFMEAASGKDAIEIYRQEHNDIRFVILDYAMAGLNGKQTYYELKKINPDLHVILCTGYAEQSSITELLREAHVKLLPKPFTIETLGERIMDVTGEDL